MVAGDDDHPRRISWLTELPTTPRQLSRAIAPAPPTLNLFAANCMHNRSADASAVVPEGLSSLGDSVQPAFLCLQAASGAERDRCGVVGGVRSDSDDDRGVDALNGSQLPPATSLILYQTEDGRTRLECRFEDGTIWLTQALLAELFQTTPQNITLHLKAIFAEGELSEAATCKDYLQVRREGEREVSRQLRQPGGLSSASQEPRPVPGRRPGRRTRPPHGPSMCGSPAAADASRPDASRPRRARARYILPTPRLNFLL